MIIGDGIFKRRVQDHAWHPDGGHSVPQQGFQIAICIGAIEDDGRITNHSFWSLLRLAEGIFWICGSLYLGPYRLKLLFQDISARPAGLNHQDMFTCQHIWRCTRLDVENWRQFDFKAEGCPVPQL